MGRVPTMLPYQAAGCTPACAAFPALPYLTSQGIPMTANCCCQDANASADGGLPSAPASQLLPRTNSGVLVHRIGARYVDQPRYFVNGASLRKQKIIPAVPTYVCMYCVGGKHPAVKWTNLELSTLGSGRHDGARQR